MTEVLKKSVQTGGVKKPKQTPASNSHALNSCFHKAFKYVLNLNI